MSDMVRFGVSINKDLLKKYDEIIGDSYKNRSEAIRDLIRNKLIEKEWDDVEEKVVGSLTLLYNHHKKGLTEKMLAIQHDFHHLFNSNLHVHLGHDFCLEVIVVEGKVKEVQSISNKLISLKGVKHGELTITTRGETFKD